MSEIELGTVVTVETLTDHLTGIHPEAIVNFRRDEDGKMFMHAQLQPQSELLRLVQDSYNS